MIKICSLDYLNKENFNTDIVLADGKVLCKAGDRVTPEKLLKLYFKEIYVNEEIQDEAEESFAAEMNLDTTQEINPTKEASKKIETDEEDKKEIPIKKSSEEGQKKTKKTRKQKEKKIESDEDNFKDEIINTGKQKSKSGLSNLDLNKEKIRKKKHFNLKPKKNDFIQPETKKSKSIDLDLAESDTLDMNAGQDNIPLEFNEEQAKRIAANSAKIAKILNFSNKEIKEIEQVAYYINYGIDEFKKADTKKRNFRQMKFLKSYEKLMAENKVPEKIAEMVKFCANNYESNAFPLDSKLPYYHIVAITSFYDELFSQNNSKEETLLKMLQIGGNKFNIFVLHKFIRMMREDNG